MIEGGNRHSISLLKTLLPTPLCSSSISTCHEIDLFLPRGPNGFRRRDAFPTYRPETSPPNNSRSPLLPSRSTFSSPAAIGSLLSPSSDSNTRVKTEQPTECLSRRNLLNHLIKRDSLSETSDSTVNSTMLSSDRLSTPRISPLSAATARSFSKQPQND